MQQVFLKDAPVNNSFYITGDDAHHLSKVVRIRIGEKLRVSSIDHGNFLCEVSDISAEGITVDIIENMKSTELSNKIYLFQALPKGDRIEYIIEKCVELGVYEIIPVEMKNCVVKLDDKKKKAKLSRYQAIAKSAAEQSKRSIIPNIHEVLSFKEALQYANSFDHRLVAYENKNGMKDTFDAIASVKPGESICIFIGPEGGIDATEIDAMKDFKILSLGDRILRTDTAAICAVSTFMLNSERIQ